MVKHRIDQKLAISLRTACVGMGLFKAKIQGSRKKEAMERRHVFSQRYDRLSTQVGLRPRVDTIFVVWICFVTCSGVVLCGELVKV